jgi:ABC-type microcin C transport system duplicated ATPase subunit YejF
MRHIRGREIAMVFQEPMTSLNPVLSIGRQLTEPLEIHLGMPPKQARQQAVISLPPSAFHPERRLTQYPHQFSGGGMRQRMMIAMALACNRALWLTKTRLWMLPFRRNPKLMKDSVASAWHRGGADHP